MRVVFPAPRKPVKTVIGIMLASEHDDKIKSVVSRAPPGTNRGQQQRRRGDGYRTRTPAIAIVPPRPLPYRRLAVAVDEQGVCHDTHTAPTLRRARRTALFHLVCPRNGAATTAPGVACVAAL